ncbi:MAG: hypothetical protein ABR502_02525 [Chitinophagaceae bacterium]
MKKWILLLSTLMLIFSLFGQEAPKKSKAVPDYIKLQFAGGVGFASVGLGYDIRDKKIEGDILYGYVPEKIGGTSIHTLTGKVTWFPLSNISLKEIQIKPLSLGFLVNYTFGSQYFLFSPENYPLDYYGYPTAMHLGVFVGGQVNKTLSDNTLFNRISLYYELGTNDVELVSYATNTKALKITDIFNLGIGVKTSF